LRADLSFSVGADVSLKYFEQGSTYNQDIGTYSDLMMCLILYSTCVILGFTTNLKDVVSSLPLREVVLLACHLTARK